MATMTVSIPKIEALTMPVMDAIQTPDVPKMFSLRLFRRAGIVTDAATLNEYIGRPAANDSCAGYSSPRSF